MVRFKSNCIIEALKAKAKDFKNVKIFIVIPIGEWEGVPHFIWYNGEQYKHFTYTREDKTNMTKWYNHLWFIGYISTFPDKFIGDKIKIKRIM